MVLLYLFFFDVLHDPDVLHFCLLSMEVLLTLDLLRNTHTTHTCKRTYTSTI